MQHIQTLIDRVRLALADERIESTPEMQELARELNSLTRKLNERLRRCGEYLRQGLRAEALQDAETEPRLLDVVGVVDSLSGEERLAWMEMMQFLELPTPEPVLYDVAEMLDEAYNEHAPLEKLLRSHRKLALQRAPLSQRLPLLRRIAKEDPNSDFWSTDVRAYEEARIAQIIQESRAGKRTLSAEAAHDLLSEVQGSVWSVSIPAKLIPNLQSQLQDATRQNAQGRMRDIAEELHRAYGAMSFSRAEHPFQEWQTLLPQSGLTENDPLVLETLAAIAWCEQQVANAASESAWADHLHAVETALNREPVRESELQQLLDRTARFQRPLPSMIESRLSSRLASFEMQRRRKRMLIGVSATLATVAVVVVSVLAFNSMQDASLRKQTAARVAGFVDAGELKAAEELRDRYHDRWQEFSEWTDASAKVDKLAASLKERAQNVELLLDRASALSETDPEGFKRLTSEATALAEQQPVLTELKRTIDVRVQKMEIARSSQMKQREEGLSSRLAAQGKQIDDLKKAFVGLPASEFDERRTQIREGLGAISSELVGMAPRLGDQHKFLLSEMTDLERRFTRGQRRAELLREMKAKSRIRANAGSIAEVEAFAALLSSFATTMEDDPQSAGMKRAAAERDAWQSLFALRDFPNDPTKLFPSSAELIATRKASIDAYLKSYPGTPFRSTMQKYQGVLSVLEKRYKPASGLVAQITADILDAEHMRDLYIIRDQNLSWPYYVLSRTELREEPIIKFTRWSVMEKPEEIKVLPKSLSSLTPKAAPQAALVKKIRDQVDALRAETWDGTMREIAQAVVAEHQVDPILRVQLLSSLCTLSKAGSLSAEKHKPFLDFEAKMTGTIERINLLTDWADPRSKDVRERRDKCLDFLREVEAADFGKVWPSSSAAMQEVQQELSTSYFAVGWMTHNDDGKPMLDLTPPSGSWTLVTNVPGSGDATSARLEVLGRFDLGMLHVAPSATTTLFVPGRLVFARPMTVNQVSSN